MTKRITQGPLVLREFDQEKDRISGAEKADAAKIRSALTRFQRKHGADAAIYLLKGELERRGEERWRLDALAPKAGADGQLSILDSGR